MSGNWAKFEADWKTARALTEIEAHAASLPADAGVQLRPSRDRTRVVGDVNGGAAAALAWQSLWKEIVRLKPRSAWGLEFHDQAGALCVYGCKAGKAATYVTGEQGARDDEAFALGSTRDLGKACAAFLRDEPWRSATARQKDWIDLQEDVGKEALKLFLKGRWRDALKRLQDVEDEFTRVQYGDVLCREVMVRSFRRGAADPAELRALGALEKEGISGAFLATAWSFIDRGAALRYLKARLKRSRDGEVEAARLVCGRLLGTTRTDFETAALKCLAGQIGPRGHADSLLMVQPLRILATAPLALDDERMHDRLLCGAVELLAKRRGEDFGGDLIDTVSKLRRAFDKRRGQTRKAGRRP